MFLFVFYSNLQSNLSECQDMRTFAAESKKKIEEIQKAYMAHADEINQMLTEKHRAEVSLF